eukprot:2895360-Rhodomonas_salina.1
MCCAFKQHISNVTPAPAAGRAEETLGPVMMAASFHVRTSASPGSTRPSALSRSVRRVTVRVSEGPCHVAARTNGHGTAWQYRDAWQGLPRTSRGVLETGSGEPTSGQQAGPSPCAKRLTPCCSWSCFQSSGFERWCSESVQRSCERRAVIHHGQWECQWALLG